MLDLDAVLFIMLTGSFWYFGKLYRVFFERRRSTPDVESPQVTPPPSDLPPLPPRAALVARVRSVFATVRTTTRSTDRRVSQATFEVDRNDLQSKSIHAKDEKVANDTDSFPGSVSTSRASLHPSWMRSIVARTSCTPAVSRNSIEIFPVTHEEKQIADVKDSSSAASYRIGPGPIPFHRDTSETTLVERGDDT
jgi:hypothetical protein